jgi:hypothetical protein
MTDDDGGGGDDATAAVPWSRLSDEHFQHLTVGYKVLQY